jgi:hypothetical protein
MSFLLLKIKDTFSSTAIILLLFTLVIHPCANRFTSVCHFRLGSSFIFHYIVSIFF